MQPDGGCCARGRWPQATVRCVQAAWSAGWPSLAPAPARTQGVSFTRVQRACRQALTHHACIFFTPVAPLAPLQPCRPAAAPQRRACGLLLPPLPLLRCATRCARGCTRGWGRAFGCVLTRAARLSFPQGRCGTRGDGVSRGACRGCGRAGGAAGGRGGRGGAGGGQRRGAGALPAALAGALPAALGAHARAAPGRELGQHAGTGCCALCA